MAKTKFKIYVTSNSNATKLTFSHFEKACQSIIGPNKYSIEIVDILKDQGAAESERILAIPTIIRTRPDPPRRVIGDITNATNANTAVQYLIGDIEL